MGSCESNTACATVPTVAPHPACNDCRDLARAGRRGRHALRQSRPPDAGHGEERMLVFPPDLVVRFKPGALVLAHRVRDTGHIELIDSRCFIVCPYGPRHGVSRGTQRGTFARYTSYSAPNVPCSVGSSYATTNRWKASQNTAPNRTSPQAPNNKA